MSRKSLRATQIKRVLFFLVALIIFTLTWAAWQVFKLKTSTAKGWFDPPTIFYTAPLKFKTEQHINAADLSELLLQIGYTERGADQNLESNEFTFMSEAECSQIEGFKTQANTRTCFLIAKDRLETFILELDYTKIIFIHSAKLGEGFTSLNEVSTLPLRFAQLSKKQFVLRTYKKLSQIPRYCLDGVLAIEDDRFLKHSGVSLRGILRAALTNIQTGRFSQGGSTLTQQLVKNKYLTSKKTLSRKVKEAWLSVLLELVLTKDQILESYLNYIYFGRTGPYSVHGIEEASKLYFSKSVSDLNLAECSLLAGTIKGPGIFGPHTKRSKERQQQVLTRMMELDLISKQEKEKATEAYVKVTYKKDANKKVQASYYVDAVITQLKKLGLRSTPGLKVYTELDYFSQRALETSMDAYLKGRSYGFFGSVLLGDNKRNSVLAMTSGVSASLNFNSAINGKRQIGSLAKPFVYLTALEQSQLKLTPETPLENIKFTYRYEGQTWTPKNYSNKNQASSYPLFEALVKSKNIPTVKLMSLFGYKKVYENVTKYGFSDFSPVTPSLALGAFEASPLEVLKSYINLSKDNEILNSELPHFIRKVTDSHGSEKYTRAKVIRTASKIKAERRALLEIIKQTLVRGTAKSTQRLKLKGYYGGKTGTTNENKDGWFASVSPDYTSVVWVGEAPYLTEKGRKLTGATAALPIWMAYTPRLEKEGRFSHEDWVTDFDTVTFKTVKASDQSEVDLLFVKSKSSTWF